MVNIPDNVRASLDPVVEESGRAVGDEIEETHCSGGCVCVRGVRWVCCCNGRGGVVQELFLMNVEGKQF